VTPGQFDTGTHRITASFTQTDVQLASGDHTDLTVTRRPTSTTVALSPTSVLVNQGSQVTVTVDDAGAAGSALVPSGTITLTSSAGSDDVFSAACALASDANPLHATLPVYVTPGKFDTGTHTITASFTQTDVQLASGDH